MVEMFKNHGNFHESEKRLHERHISVNTNELPVIRIGRVFWSNGSHNHRSSVVTTAEDQVLIYAWKLDPIDIVGWVPCHSEEGLRRPSNRSIAMNSYECAFSHFRFDGAVPVNGLDKPPLVLTIVPMKADNRIAWVGLTVRQVKDQVRVMDIGDPEMASRLRRHVVY